MYFQQLASQWHEFHRQQLASVRIVLVSPDHEVTRSLDGELSPRGYTVEIVEDLVQAQPLLRRGAPDLLLVDIDPPAALKMESLPSEPGVSLACANEALVLLTRAPQSKSKAEALRAIAADVLEKPLSSPALAASRLRTILDKRASELLFAVIFSDLRKSLLSGEGLSPQFSRLAEDILAIKKRQGQRIPCALIDDSPARSLPLCECLREGGVVAVAMTANELLDSSTPPPMIAVLSPACPRALDRADALRSKYPAMPILLLANSLGGADAERAAACVTDWAPPSLTPFSPAIRRVKRLLRIARRHDLHIKTTETLCLAAYDASPDLTRAKIFSRCANT